MYEFLSIISCATYNRHFFSQYSIRLDEGMKRARTMNRNKLIISVVREIDRDRSCNVLQVAEHAGQGCACISLSDNPSDFLLRGGYDESYRFSCIEQLALHFSTFFRPKTREVESCAREIHSQNTVRGIPRSIALIIIARFERTFQSRRTATLIADRYLYCTL